jgi:hypothetical protein
MKKLFEAVIKGSRSFYTNEKALLRIAGPKFKGKVRVWVPIEDLEREQALTDQLTNKIVDLENELCSAEQARKSSPNAACDHRG